MATATAQPISSVTEDEGYTAAFEAAEKARKVLKERLVEREKVRKAATRGAPPALDADAIIAGQRQPEGTSDHTFNDQFDRLTAEIRTLRPHVVKLEVAEVRARRRATARITKSYESACLERAKKFVKALSGLYELELEQEAMLRHLRAESGSEFTPRAILPLPDFQRRWIVAQVARMYKRHDIPVPKVLLHDPWGVDLLANPYGVKVK